MKLSVFEYTDYRKFLEACIADKKTNSRAFSISALAIRTKCMTKGYLSLVINRKRNLSATKASCLATALGLNTREVQYFQAMTSFNHATTLAQKELFWAKMKVSRPQKLNAASLLESEEILSQWHSLSIRELLAHPQFNEDPAAISKQLKHRITAAEADRAIQLMLKNGLIHRENGRLCATQQTLATTDEVKSLAVQKYHRSCLNLGQEILKDEELDCREFASVNLLVSKKKFAEIKNLIKEFRNELLKMQWDESPSTELCQFNIQFFKLNGEKK